jgi:hypothetical protein
MSLHYIAGCWWLKSVIIATQEAEIRRLRFKASLGKQFAKPYLPMSKITNIKNGWRSGSSGRAIA